MGRFVNLFHRKVAGIERKLDVNEQAQRYSQHEQDRSEIRSVKFERLAVAGYVMFNVKGFGRL